ncbi:acetyl-CoA carboxylase biotin carboxylase subunit [Bacillus sp. Marseille-P3661]|uniref:acetyl-CoA carboxylase biotin carboxylase subunit n=1 Tax=Bacillus sp. Marseille-P3661 TaxID=1936234 RepID=UPI000C83298A|nr:acetyl-CoA carboxylase biotin carboxylase subunit [Bacillus sp. Marseille-P3661]
MFSKILIANRGEIAARIIRTCKKMGIETVAVYSEADKDAPYVSFADESYCIGGPRVHESYLQAEKIIDIAKRTGSEAIHPGYGLLSENAGFAKRCKDAGVTFIGPSPDVIEQMGEKVKARTVMKGAGVPIVPGSEQAVTTVEEAEVLAAKIGYPVMLKAVAGGGGIGMQVVNAQVELAKVFEGNQKRAQMFFGNGEMYIEKLIKNPRHIEIQVLADAHGNTITLGERECSIQRRHQKIIEEAPSHFLDDKTRQAMCETVVTAAKAIHYINAGTVEFLIDDNMNFYFLEMNTRLQVEHPVTEEVTRLDLVEEQIRIAANEKLRWTQQEIQLLGHAIEVRIYAEDPVTFLPSPGKITSLNLPSGKQIRHELAIQCESVVTPFYDPMIAKLIVTATSRDDAISSLIKALQNYEITGIKTNIPLLLKVIGHPEFKAGNTTTQFLGKYIN